MTNAPLISICIPAYKNVDYLKRLLDSITIQSFKNYEVIVTDDSPDDDVHSFIASFQGIENLRYARNVAPLGTPENWNAAIRLAKGDWIKLMHDDDWFQSAGSLNIFANEISKSPTVDFIYSAYSNVLLSSGASTPVRASRFRRWMLRGNPATLASKNIIGPPSVVLYKRNELFYDRRLKWLVDIDFYIRYLEGKQVRYVDKALINIGIGELQVTKTASRIKHVEVPEFFMLFEKIGFSSLRNVWVFDAWWRLVRNFSIRDVDDVETAGYKRDLHPIIKRIIRFQSRLPVRWLRFGVTSKMFMMLCFLVSRKRGD